MTATMPRGALPPPSRPPLTGVGRGAAWPSPWVRILRQRLHDIPPEPPIAPPPPPPPPENEPVRDPPSPDQQAPVRDPPRNPALS